VEKGKILFKELRYSLFLIEILSSSIERIIIDDYNEIIRDRCEKSTCEMFFEKDNEYYWESKELYLFIKYNLTF